MSHTHTRTLENWVIFYLHSSQNDFFPFWRNCSSVYQFYCPFCYNFKTEFRVTAKSTPFFSQFFAANFKILIVCTCFIFHVLWLDFFQKKSSTWKKIMIVKIKKSNIKNVEKREPSIYTPWPNALNIFKQRWQVKTFFNFSNSLKCSEKT